MNSSLLTMQAHMGGRRHELNTDRIPKVHCRHVRQHKSMLAFAAYHSGFNDILLSRTGLFSSTG
jgi:hypothetical protein